MFFHVFLGIRDFEHAGKRWRAHIVWMLAAAAATGAWETASAEHVAMMGELVFAPGATALTAGQRQALDELQRRQRPLCVVLGVRRSDGPVTELTTLEAARVAYATRLFSMRDVAVIASGIGWRRPAERVEPIWADTLGWEVVPCPGAPKPARDWTQPQP